MAEINDEMSDNQQVLELGIMLGQRRAFGLVTGRCSAAQAECLRKVRDEKTYLKFATTSRRLPSPASHRRKFSELRRPFNRTAFTLGAT